MVVLEGVWRQGEVELRWRGSAQEGLTSSSGSVELSVLAERKFGDVGNAEEIFNNRVIR